jgi:mRNA interferase RelE/StbE
VNVVYTKTFVKDLKRLKGTPAFERVKEIAFEIVPGSASLDEVPNLKKLEQAHYAYRIRIGDYRLGFTLEDDTVSFKRVLHRKEIHCYFP